MIEQIELYTVGTAGAVDDGAVDCGAGADGGAGAAVTVGQPFSSRQVSAWRSRSNRLQSWLHWSINGTVNGPFTNHLPLIRVTKPVTHYGRINSRPPCVRCR
eukprot:scaffold65476_cov69-Phaeocystis_antarctica.AAC.1